MRRRQAFGPLDLLRLRCVERGGLSARLSSTLSTDPPAIQVRATPTRPRLRLRIKLPSIMSMTPTGTHRRHLQGKPLPLSAQVLCRAKDISRATRSKWLADPQQIAPPAGSSPAQILFLSHNWVCSPTPPSFSAQNADNWLCLAQLPRAVRDGPHRMPCAAWRAAYYEPFVWPNNQWRASVNDARPAHTARLSEDRQLDCLWARVIHFYGKVQYAFEVQVGGNTSNAIERLEMVAPFVQKAVVVTDDPQRRKIEDRLAVKHSPLRDKLVFLSYDDVNQVAAAMSALSVFTGKVFHD